MESLAWPSCLKDAHPASPFSSFLPACCISASQGRGETPSGGTGDVQSCDVGDRLTPETTVPFMLTCCNSSRRKEKSVFVNDTKPHSLLILSSFSFLFPWSPLIIACHARVYKSCRCSPSSSVIRSCRVPATPPAAPPPMTSHPVSPLSFLHLWQSVIFPSPFFFSSLAVIPRFCCSQSVCIDCCCP